ncbi:MAG: hypothetical protein MI923_25665 [Phycisphaerales bacterium]|nr:hypothetical protein [Phycisphaerales bacterium]
MRHNHLTKRADDRDFKLAVEEVLSDHSPMLRFKAGKIVSSPSWVDEMQMPALSLAHEEEPDAMVDHTDDQLARQAVSSKSIPMENEVEDDCWPWVDDGAEDLLVPNNVTEASRHVEEEGESLDNSDDQSATEDLVLCEPPAAQAEMLTLKAGNGGSSEKASTAEVSKGVRQPGVAPKRIGSGTLVPARLTWKPGDPFGEDAEPAGSRFRWEIMLRSACITAACGLLCVWLLHSIFA